MKCVIRNMKDGTFYRSPNEWVRSAKEATNIGGVAHALELMVGQDFANLELLDVTDEGRPQAGHYLLKLAEVHQQTKT